MLPTSETGNSIGPAGMKGALARLSPIFPLLQLNVLFSWDDSVQKRPTGTSWLDGLRGVAALQVYFFHFFGLHAAWGHPYGATPDDYYLHQLPIFRPVWCGGAAAVCVFFVISGFAITIKSLTLLRRGQHKAAYESLASSLIRRGFRLYLPVIAVGIVGLILIRTVDMVKGGTFSIKFERKDTLGEQILDFVNKTDIHLSPFAYADTNPSNLRYAYAPSSWTIPLEYYGSLASYLMILIISRSPRFLTRCLLIGFASLYAMHRGCWWVSLFLNGMLLADITIEQRDRTEKLMKQHPYQPSSWLSRQALYQVPFLILVFCGWYLAGLPPKVLPFDFNPVPRVGYQFLYALYPSHDLFHLVEATRWWWYWSGMFTVVGISQVPWLRRVFEMPFCQWLGKLSFSLYLIHPAVIAVFAPGLKIFIKGISENLAVEVFFKFAILTPVIFIISALTERWVDRPSVQISRWFEQVISAEAKIWGGDEVSLASRLDMDEQASFVLAEDVDVYEGEALLQNRISRS